MGFGFGRGKGGGASRRQVAPICGNCICPNCNTVIPHKRGVPCFQTACPNCGRLMTRKFNPSSEDLS
jgi:hypothetical protein